MTVVCWDKRTLAADTYCTTSDGEPIYGTKIWRTPCGLYGGAGDDPAVEIVRLWLMSGGKVKNRPPSFNPKETSFIGMLISPRRELFIVDCNLVPVSYFNQPFAIGSGAQAAMALMRTGLNAGQAVQKIIDDKLVDGCWGEVETLTLGRKKAIRKR